jgi:uncharacterized membrane protein YdjX (TVP38/TMEM64 family)
MNLELATQARDWFAGLGPWGPLVYFACFVIANLVFVPASALTVPAGFFFGFFPALAIAMVGRPISAMIAFRLAHHSLRERVARWAERFAVFAAIDRAMGKAGMRLVLLLRLSPVVPSTPCNYLLGLTSVGFRDFAVGSALGTVPSSLLYAYLGSSITRLAWLFDTQRDTGHVKQYEEWLFWLGLAAMVLLVTWVTRLARRELDLMLRG